MKKNSLKKVFAALALSTVAATSISAISAAAAESVDYANGTYTYELPDGTEMTVNSDQMANAPAKNVITIETKEITAEEAKAGVEVTLNVSVSSGDWASTGVHFNHDTTNLEATNRAWATSVAMSEALGSKKIEQSSTGWFFTTAGDQACGCTEYATLTYKVIAEDPQPGDFYPVTLDFVQYDKFGNVANNSFDSGIEKVEANRLSIGWAFLNRVNGGIKIKEEEPTTEPTTEPSTEAPTTEPTTEPSSEAKTTEAPKTTTAKATTKKGTTSSPKTGVAGVGVAAAGLVVAAGAAFVLRKKED